MPALNFLARLAPLVESGAKTHTVRRRSKRPIKEGDRLYLFTGMRTKNCRRLMDTECVQIQDIHIDFCGWSMTLDGEFVDYDAFARADGLKDFHELVCWIGENYGLPFDGVVIHWRHNTKSPADSAG